MEVAFRSLDCGVLKGETGTRCCCRNAFREKNLVPGLKYILLVFVEGCKFSPSRGSRPHEGKKRRTMFLNDWDDEAESWNWRGGTIYGT